MTDRIYPQAKKGFQSADIDMLADNIKVVLVDLADYTYDDAHEFLTDVPSGARISTSPNLSGKVLDDDGTFHSDNPVFTAVTGDTFEAVVVYQDTGSAATSRLIAYYDNDVTGLPGTPSGEDWILLVDSTGWWTL